VSDEIIGKADGLLLTLLDLLPDYFYVIDSDMRVVYVNKTAADYFRLPKEEIIGREWQTIEPNQDVARAVVELGRQIMADGRPRVSDGEPYPEPDGTTSYYRRYDIPFHHPRTGEPMLLGLAQEVTAQVEREQQERRLAVMRREMEIAQEIQRTLFPRTLRTDRIDLAGACVPAAYAGGDFYDWLLASDGSVVVTLGDVSGHGVGPALVAAECRAYWRVLARTLPLRDAVVRLNELIVDDLPDDRFVTLAAARLYPDGMVEVFSAGHGPLLLRRANGTVDELQPHTLPLGITPELPIEEITTRRLTPGGTLLMFSDGVTEIRDAAGRQWQTAGVLDFLARSRGLAGDDLLRALNRENLAFADGQPAEDDRTLVVATLRGA
jgi:PAS domain S-box-containing protein